MRPVAILVCGLILLGCEKIDYLEIKPEQVFLKQPKNETRMQAKAMSRTGTQAARAAIGWSVKDPAIASIDATGKVKPLKSGHTEILATHGSITASVPLDVLFVEKVEVKPTEVTVKEGGDQVELKVKAFDYQGRELKDRTPTYRSVDPKIVSMGQNAVFGLAPGTSSVEVQVDGVKASVKVVVEADAVKPKK